MPFKLPFLIFAESHYDPITGIMLAELLPYLKKKGYGSFYDEIPQCMGENFLNYIEDEEQKYQKLTIKLEELKLKISEKNDVNQYLLSLKGDNNEKDWLNQTEEIQENIDKHDARKSFINFLHRMQKLKINYQAIDSNLMTLNIPFSELVKLTKIRDAEMTQFYLSAPHPVFGRIGLRHVEGIQEEVLNNVPLKEAEDGFLFFHVYSREVENYTDWQYLEDLKSGKTKLPIKVIFIDATNLSINDVLDLIKEQIEKKERSLAKHNKKQEKEDILIDLEMPHEDDENSIECPPPYLEIQMDPRLFNQQTDKETKETKETKKPPHTVRWSK